MDAARVDGLARTLQEVAKSRQVIVFTHDARLPEACRRLDVPARVLEVTRGDHSQVCIRGRKGPVEDYLDDTQAVLITDGYVGIVGAFQTGIQRAPPNLVGLNGKEYLGEESQ